MCRFLRNQPRRRVRSGCDCLIGDRGRLTCDRDCLVRCRDCLIYGHDYLIYAATVLYAPIPSEAASKTRPHRPRRARSGCDCLIGGRDFLICGRHCLLCGRDCLIYTRDCLIRATSKTRPRRPRRAGSGSESGRDCLICAVRP